MAEVPRTGVSQPNLVVAGGHNNNACPLGGAHLVETTRINLVVRTFSIQLSIFWCQTSFVNDVTISYFVHIVSCSVSRNPVYTVQCVHLFPIGLSTNCVRCHKKVKYSQTGPLNENSLRYSLGLLTMCFTERHYWCYSLRHIVLFFCVPEIHILLIPHLRNKQRIGNRLKWLPKFSPC